MSVPAYAFFEAPTLPLSYTLSGDLLLPAFGGEQRESLPVRNKFFGKFSIRVHEKWMQQGDLKGTNFHYAEVEEVSPKIIIWASEWSHFLAEGYGFRGLIFSVEPELAFEVDSARPRDDQTITLNVFRLDPKRAAGFPVPEG